MNNPRFRIVSRRHNKIQNKFYIVEEALYYKGEIIAWLSRSSCSTMDWAESVIKDLREEPEIIKEYE